MNNSLLALNGIHKYFSGVHALNNVFFELKSGEVHALVGENGAGKSTLMKIISGIHVSDAGDMSFENKPYSPESPADAQSAGIQIIHQELNMMDHLTVAQNIFIGRESTTLGFLSEKKQNQKAATLLKNLNMDIDPIAPMHSLTVGKQQMVEIAKAVSHEIKVLILDEPTAALTSKEIEDLFSIIRALAKKQVGMIYISHRMDEIKKITDRVTIMRDGAYVDTVITQDTGIEEIVKMMVGRTVYDHSDHKVEENQDTKIVLQAKNLNAGNQVQDVSFHLRQGEILGFAGLMGSGRTETMRALFGADEATSDEIKINGEVVNICSPQDAVHLGIGYLSEDRKRYGLAIRLDVKDNSVMGSYENFSNRGFVQDKKIADEVSEYVERLKIKTPGIDQLVSNLSGGNQQKVVIAKWLIRDCEILIFDEPTRGIDVGAKSEIYSLMKQLVNEEGKSIIMISSELPEVLRMSDRVVVMCEGRITGEISGTEVNEENIMKYATARVTA